MNMVKQQDPIIVDGIQCYAPELARENNGFDPEFHEVLSALEKINFWFTSRNKLIVTLIKKYFSNHRNFCEVGCGNGFVLSGISKNIPSLSLWGSEIYVDPLRTAQQRLPDATLFQSDLCNFPHKDTFDVVGAFDVLEHIQDDSLALKNIYESLTDSGGLIITVPQHKWLWSLQDDFACHKRRYTKKELHGKLNSAGFDIVFTSSFVFFLLPLMLLSRLISKNNTNNSKESLLKELSPPFFLNYLFGKICCFENFLITLNISLPVGGSLIFLAKKKKI